MEDRKFFVHPSSYVDDNVTLGDGTKIWHFCHVQAGAVVTGDVKDYALMAGVPARQIGWVCECGRRLDDTLKCPCGREFLLDGECLKKKP